MITLSSSLQPVVFTLSVLVVIDKIKFQDYRGWNKLFLTSHFCCWGKLHYISPIATTSFGGAVSPLFDPAFTGSFPHFSYNKVSDLQQKINLFSLILFNIFLRKSHHPLLYCSQQPWNPKQKRFTFLHSQHSKRLLSVIAHKHSIKYIESLKFIRLWY